MVWEKISSKIGEWYVLKMPCVPRGLKHPRDYIAFDNRDFLFPKKSLHNDGTVCEISDDQPKNIQSYHWSLLYQLKMSSCQLMSPKLLYKNRWYVILSLKCVSQDVYSSRILLVLVGMTMIYSNMINLDNIVPLKQWNTFSQQCYFVCRC